MTSTASPLGRSFWAWRASPSTCRSCISPICFRAAGGSSPACWWPASPAVASSSTCSTSSLWLWAAPGQACLPSLSYRSTPFGFHWSWDLEFIGGAILSGHRTQCSARPVFSATCGGAGCCGCKFVSVFICICLSHPAMAPPSVVLHATCCCRFLCGDDLLLLLY